jgi:uncharacterized repeat protein (TIGR01451 family)
MNMIAAQGSFPMYVPAPARNGVRLIAVLFALCLLLIGGLGPSRPAAAATLDIPVTTSRDDAEEIMSSGVTALTSEDLEMPWDGSKVQQIGMRFQNVGIPVGATITNAYIQFTVNRPDTGGLVNLMIKGEKATAAETFSNTKFNISSRARTTAGVSWSPPSWTVTNAAGEDQRTPNLSGILQELIDQPGWASGNPVAILIQDNGSGSKRFRAAHTVNGPLGLAGAPVLHVAFATQSTVSAPTIAPNGGTFENSVSVSLDTATAGAAIYYTLDGTAPTRSSNLYSAPFNLTSSATVKAVAVRDGYADSGVATAAFTIGHGWPTTGWATATPADAGMNQSLLDQARTYALTGGGSGFITRGGKLVMSWGDTRQIYNLRSSTKSIGVSALGLALQDGRVTLNDSAQVHLPGVGVPPDTNLATGWLGDITLQHLATHTAGFEKDGGFGVLLYQPGSTWSYSDGGANWLADVLTVVFGADLNTVLFNRLFSKLGITTADLTWRNNAFRDDTINGIKRREFGSGIRANVDAMARIGYLYLRGGSWDGETILPQGFVDQVGQANPSVVGLPVSDPSGHVNASNHYGLLWWNNADGTLAGVPTDAYWSWGLDDSLIIVIPSLDIVVARAGSGWRSGWNSDYSVLEPFIGPIVQSVSSAGGGNVPPTAAPDTLETSMDTQGNVDVLANDSDGGDGGTLSITAFDATSVNGGTVYCVSTGLCTYMPTPGFSGSDSFTYTVSDSFDTAVGTVNVTVTSSTGGSGTGGFQQDGSGLVSMEAEHFQTSVAASSGHEWLPAGAEFGGYSGTGALRALPEDNVSNNTSYANVSPRLDYQVNFALTGTHYIWVRMQAPSLGSDSFHVGLNGQEVGNGTNMRGPVTGGYVWAGTKANGSRASLSIGTAGLHTVNVWMRESGTVIDKVILTPDAAFDPSTINGGLGPNESVRATPTGADLSVTKAVDNATPLEGDTVVYTVTVTNHGPVDATGVSLSDVLPAGLTYVGDDAAASNTFYDSGTGVWAVGSLSNAGAATLHITATVNLGTAGSTLTNTASVSGSDQPDPVQGNDSAAVDVTVVAQGNTADLAVTKSVDDASPSEGGTVVYTVTVTNNGLLDATGVSVTDVLPVGLTYISDDAAASEHLV